MDVGNQTSVKYSYTKDLLNVEAAWRERCEALETSLQEKNAELEAQATAGQRLTQELHDALSQSLFSAGLIAEVLPRLWEHDQAAALRSLEDLRRLTFGALAELRIIYAESNPTTIAGTDLADLLRLLGNVLAGRLNIPVIVEISGKNSPPPDMKNSLFLLCKEYLLGQLARNASASRVEMNFQGSKGAAAIHIVDNGSKMDPPGDFIDRNREFTSILDPTRSLGIKLDILERSDGWNELVIRWMNPPARGKKK